jgi:hypothetical protein
MDPERNEDVKELRDLLERFNAGTLDDAGKERALELMESVLGEIASGGLPADFLLRAFDE